MLGDLNRRLYRSFFICELLWPAIEPWSRYYYGETSGQLSTYRLPAPRLREAAPRADKSRQPDLPGGLGDPRGRRGWENLQRISTRIHGKPHVACKPAVRSAPKTARHGSRHLPADGRRLKPRRIRTGCPRYRQIRPAIRPVADFSNPIQKEIKCATPTQTN